MLSTTSHGSKPREIQVNAAFTDAPKKHQHGIAPLYDDESQEKKDEDAIPGVIGGDVNDCPSNNPELTKKHRKAVKSVYGMTIWPHNEEIINGSASIPDVLSENINGRIYNFGYHSTPIDVAEYFYGLTPNRIVFGPNITAYIGLVQMTEFLNCGKIASSKINYQVVTFANPSVIVSNGTQVGFWRFDNHGKILEYELYQPMYTLSYRLQFPNASTDLVYQLGIIQFICQKHTMNCLGSNQQYVDYPTCVSFLQTVEFGEPDLESWNNVLCRYRHAPLTLLRPIIHCPHIGPTGGNQCHTFTPASLFVPLFTSPNRLIGSDRYL
jgi:hypothetical protein